MKKFILVMVFVLLTALFIAFNYLLLDRESREKEFKNLEAANVSNNASISAQKREIDSLAEKNRSLEDTIDRLEDEKEQLLQGQTTLSAEKDKSNLVIKEKVDYINVLKQHIDIKILSEPLASWAEALSQGKYEEAYELEYAGILEKDRPVSLEKYTEEMKKTIRKIEVSEIKLDKLRGAGNGEIFLEARLNVKLAEDADERASRFTEGVNDKYIKIDYSYEKKTFIISAINSM